MGWGGGALPSCLRLLVQLLTDSNPPSSHPSSHWFLSKAGRILFSLTGSSSVCDNGKTSEALGFRLKQQTSQVINPRSLPRIPSAGTAYAWYLGEVTPEKPRPANSVRKTWPWNLRGATAVTAPLESGFGEIHPSPSSESGS